MTKLEILGIIGILSIPLTVNWWPVIDKAMKESEK